MTGSATLEYDDQQQLPGEQLDSVLQIYQVKKINKLCCQIMPRIRTLYNYLSLGVRSQRFHVFGPGKSSAYLRFDVDEEGKSLQYVSNPPVYRYHR